MNRTILVSKVTWDRLYSIADSKWRRDPEGNYWQLFKSKKDYTVICIRRAINGEVVLIKEKSRMKNILVLLPLLLLIGCLGYETEIVNQTPKTPGPISDISVTVLDNQLNISSESSDKWDSTNNEWKEE